MPAGFTHILLAKTFTENATFSNNIKNDLVNLLDGSLDFFQVGSIGPDLPYSQMANPFNKEQEIADKFHYEQTNQIPLRCLREVKKINDLEMKDKAFSFFLGYISHIVADGIIHPFVRDKVGPYKENADAHRKLEMRLDVLFLDHLTSSSGSRTDINNSKIQDEILNISDSFEHIAEIFSSKINEIYNLATTKDTIEGWIKGMENLFELAANENNQPFVDGFLYKNAHELKASKDKDLILSNEDAVGRDSNFRSKDTHFLNDCIPEYYKALSPIAEKAYIFVYLDGEELSENDLPAINLDTGRMIAFEKGYDLAQKAEYWS